MASSDPRVLSWEATRILDDEPKNPGSLAYEFLRSYALTNRRNYESPKVVSVRFSKINWRMTGTKSCRDSA